MCLRRATVFARSIRGDSLVTSAGSGDCGSVPPALGRPGSTNDLDTRSRLRQQLPGAPSQFELSVPSIPSTTRGGCPLCQRPGCRRLVEFTVSQTNHQSSPSEGVRRRSARGPGANGFHGLPSTFSAAIRCGVMGSATLPIPMGQLTGPKRPYTMLPSEPTASRLGNLEYA